MEINKRNPLFYLLVMILLMACTVSLSALPLPRNLASEINQEPTVQFGQQEEVTKENDGRMDMEVNDYPGSGPNTRHDPKSPGTP